MKHITMFWNNICVLHKQEMAYLIDSTIRLRKKGIELSIESYGLGFPFHMSDYLRKDDSILPDIIVSTDLEVFEDQRIFSKFERDLYPVCNWYKQKQTEGVSVVYRGDFLLPFLIIPLVFFSADRGFDQSFTLKDVIDNEIPFAFGGINNSAGKSVVKTIWSRYGIEAVKRLLGHAKVTPMPVQAFNLAKTRKVSLALVPSLFAMNSIDGQAFCPIDGAVAVPSYIGIRNTVTQADAKAVMDELLNPELLSFFVQKGNLICPIAGSEQQRWMIDQGSRLQITSQQWLSETTPQKFYDIYFRAQC
jgi:hypothetical protein